MNTLSDVSETALITLRCRVIEAERKNPVIEDRIGRECLNRIKPLLSSEVRNRIMNRKLSASLTRHIALRSRKYDEYARTFIKEHPDGMVISLGCGFDTRYWRVSEKPWNYVEIDLPEVITMKKKILNDIIDYKMIGSSVLEEAWITQIESMQKEHLLFLAEGLFMYLPKTEVTKIFKRLSETFSSSQIVFEIVNERFTKGIWKKTVEMKMKRNIGTTAGTSYTCGVKKATDIEAYGKNIKVVEEWSYFEDEDIQPRILRLFRHSKFLSKTQWTIKALLI
jgi:methyltransferase (TIGR00027 family)